MNTEKKNQLSSRLTFQTIVRSISFAGGFALFLFLPNILGGRPFNHNELISQNCSGYTSDGKYYEKKKTWDAVKRRHFCQVTEFTRPKGQRTDLYEETECDC